MGRRAEAARDASRALTPFADVYAEHAAAVHRYCVSQARDRDTAEDLTHETFAKAVAAYERVAPDPDGLRCSRTEQQLIGLRVAADLSFHEVAAVMGMQEPAAKTATYRALTKLRSIVEMETKG